MKGEEEGAAGLGAMSCLKKCSAKLLLVIAAALYFLFGLGMAIGFGVALTSDYAELIPEPWIIGVGLAAGIGILLISLLGCAAACSTKRASCFLGVFSLFTFVLAVGFAAAAAYSFDSATVLTAASSVSGSDRAHEVSGDAFAATRHLSEAVSVTASTTFRACHANVSAVGPPTELAFSLTCANRDYRWLDECIDSLCLGTRHPVAGAPDSAFAACYDDPTVHWADSTNSSDVAERIATPRGLFCQCSDELAGAFLGMVQGVGALFTVLSVFFFAVFAAATYLMCCAKYGRKVAARERTLPPAERRPESALVQRMRAKYQGGGDASTSHDSRSERLIGSSTSSSAL